MKISVKVKPKAGKEKVEKTEGGYIVILKAVPEKGKANEALVRVIAEYFGVARARVRVASGLKSKNKIVEIK